MLPVKRLLTPFNNLKYLTIQSIYPSHLTSQIRVLRPRRQRLLPRRRFSLFRRLGRYHQKRQRSGSRRDVHELCGSEFER